MSNNTKKCPLQHYFEASERSGIKNSYFGFAGVKTNIYLDNANDYVNYGVEGDKFFPISLPNNLSTNEKDIHTFNPHHFCRIFVRTGRHRPYRPAFLVDRDEE